MNAPAEPPKNISPLETYQLFRNRIEHEDNLIMQRLSWLMASQSFLFTAYAIVTNGLTTSPTTGGNSFVNHLLVLARIIPVVALLNSLLILVSILAALKAIREMRNRYHHITLFQTAGLHQRVLLQKRNAVSGRCFEICEGNFLHPFRK